MEPVPASPVSKWLPWNSFWTLFSLAPRGLPPPSVLVNEKFPYLSKEVVWLLCHGRFNTTDRSVLTFIQVLALPCLPPAFSLRGKRRTGNHTLTAQAEAGIKGALDLFLAQGKAHSSFVWALWAIWAPDINVMDVSLECMDACLTYLGVYTLHTFSCHLPKQLALHLAASCYMYLGSYQCGFFPHLDKLENVNPRYQTVWKNSSKLKA